MQVMLRINEIERIFGRFIKKVKNSFTLEDEHEGKMKVGAIFHFHFLVFNLKGTMSESEILEIIEILEMGNNE